MDFLTIGADYRPSEYWGTSQPSGGFWGTFPIFPNKYTSLSEHITDGSGKVDFKRRLLEEEVEHYSSLLLQTISRRWSIGTGGMFTVKSLYSKLTEDEGMADFPHRFVWNNTIPPKVTFLVWCACHGKLNTVDMLRKKRVYKDDCCYLCGDSNETANNLFLHCKVAVSIWKMVTPSNWGWTFPEHVIDLAKIWSSLVFSSSPIWNLIPAAVIWVIWTERNARIHKERHIFKTDEDLGIEEKSLVFAWARAFGHLIHSANFS